MGKSPKIVALSVLAVISFPVTIALVALDLRSFLGQQVPSAGQSESSPSRSEGSSPSAASASSGDSNANASAATSGSKESAASADVAVLQVLQKRAEDLTSVMKKTKEQEKEILQELEKNKEIQKVTRKSLKATERAIHEIVKQAPSTVSPTLRGNRAPGTGVGRTVASQPPEGWQAYYGVLGVGFVRGYSPKEFSDLQQFLGSLMSLPPTASLPVETNAPDLKLHRIVHLSGLSAEDPILAELRRLGSEREIEFKRVRAELPGFETPALMVQVLPAGQRPTARIEELPARTEATSGSNGASPESEASP